MKMSVRLEGMVFQID